MPDPGRVRVKICGLKDDAHIAAAVEAGAAYLGFVFFGPSPRDIPIEQAARLTSAVRPGIMRVALTVDAEDGLLDRITGEVGIDMLQLHGSESPARVSEIKTRYGLPVMKAIGVRDAGDLDAIGAYAKVADQLLIDAKPPRDAVLPGGNGLSFDWRLLQGRRWPVPWMLAGGLTAETVPEAIRLTGARQIDVSSGVEASKGVKDPALIRAFIDAATKAPAPIL